MQERRGAFSEILSCSSPVIMLYTRVQGAGFGDRRSPRGRFGLGVDVPKLRGQGVLMGLRIRPSWTLQVRLRRDAFSQNWSVWRARPLHDASSVQLGIAHVRTNDRQLMRVV